MVFSPAPNRLEFPGPHSAKHLYSPHWNGVNEAQEIANNLIVLGAQAWRTSAVFGY